MRKKLGTILACAIIALATAGIACAAENKVTMLTPHDTGISGSVSLDKTEYAVGETIRVKTTVSCRSGERLFNPFFNQLLEVPGRIRVFDDKGSLIFHYFDRLDGSRRSPGAEDWIFLSSSQFVGSVHEVRPFIDRMADKPIPPGKYKMQLILTKALLEGETNAKEPDIIAASDVVEFTVKVKTP